MATTTQYPAAGIRSKTQTRPVSPISRQTGVFVALCTIGLLTYAFLQLFIASEVAATLKSNIALEEQQKRLRVEYDQLVLEAERLQSPSTIETSAISLGLKPLVVERIP